MYQIKSNVFRRSVFYVTNTSGIWSPTFRDFATMQILGILKKNQGCWYKANISNALTFTILRDHTLVFQNAVLTTLDSPILKQCSNIFVTHLYGEMFSASTSEVMTTDICFTWQFSVLWQIKSLINIINVVCFILVNIYPSIPLVGPVCMSCVQSLQLPSQILG